MSAMAPEFLLRQLVRDSQQSPIRTMLTLAGEPGMISLAGGHPDPALLPRDWFIDCARNVLEKLDHRALQYGGTEGVPSLRASICLVLAARQIQAQPEEILITTGSQQGISLLASVLIEPGDSVVMARYNYPAALQAFRFAGAKVLALDDDAEGIGQLMRAAQGGRVKAVYLVPSFANPTAHCMSLDARVRLLQEAARAGICIIEDDPYGELWFGRPPPESLCALNQLRNVGATVVYLTSFSKIVMPALRLGALFAPAPIRRAVVLAKQSADVHSGTLEQMFLDRMLKSGRLSEHLGAIRTAYERKAGAMTDTLRSIAGGMLSFVEPAGGMFVWASLADSAIDASDIDWFAFGRQYRVLALPGRAFASGDAPEPHIRLSFANPAIEDVREGVVRLAAGLTAEKARHGCGGAR